MATTVVVRRQDGSEDELTGDFFEVTKGVLTILSTETSAKTTKTRTRFLLWSNEETVTSIERKRYTSAVYPNGKWIAAYAKVSKKTPAPPETT